MKKLNKKGFTLVELLAVIVILALLMVVGIRTITNLQDDAQFEAAKTEGAKMAARNYEDIKTLEILPAHEMTYPNLASGQVEGEFTVWISGDNICVTYSNKGHIRGTVSDGSVTWTSTTFDSGVCASAEGPAA